MGLFDKTLHQSAKSDALDKIAEQFSAKKTQLFVGDNTISAKYVGACESDKTLEASDLQMLNDRFDTVYGEIRGMDIFAGLSEGACESVTRTAMMLDNDASDFMAAFRKGKDIIGACESITAEKVKASKNYTIALAGLLADRLDAVDEFIFPTISAGAQFGEVKITLDRYVIVGNTKHDEGLTDWDRVHLTDTNLKEGLLSNDQHILYPVYTDANAAEFVAPALNPLEVIPSKGGEDFRTNFLALNDKAVNLLTLARASSMSDKGQLDILDRINDGVALRDLLIQVGASANNKAVKVSLSTLKAAQFHRRANSKSKNERTAILAGETVNIPLVSGIAEMQALIAKGYASINVALELTMHLNLHNGTFTRGNVKTTVVGLYHKDGAGENHVEAEAELVTALELVAKGVRLSASLSSATMRLNGDRLSTQEAEFVYQLTAQSPVTSESTIEDAGITGVLELLSYGVNVRRRESGLVTLRTAFDSLKEQFADGAEYDARETNMPGLYYMARPWVKEIRVPVSKLIKEDDSMNRIPNFNSAIMALVSDKIHEGVQKTNLLENKRTYLNNRAATIDFGIVGDSMLVQYLLVNGEERTLGGMKNAAGEDTFNLRGVGVELETYQDTFYAFPRASESEATKIFGFGFTIDAPSIVIDTELQQNEGKKTVLQVHPVYQQYISTPYLLKFVVEGARKYFEEASRDYIVSKTEA